MSDLFVHDLSLTLPLSIVAVGILLVVLLGRRHPGIIACGVLIGAACFAHTMPTEKIEVVNRLLVMNGRVLLFWKISLWIAAGIALIGASNRHGDETENHQEVFILLLTSILGALVFISSNELLTMFFGLELMSLPLYCLCGSSLFKRESAEAAFKYFILGSFSSAFFLFGVSLEYGLHGTTFIGGQGMQIATLLDSCAVGLLLLGILFKLGAAPFQYWVPDVYEGSPTFITLYMSTVVKVATFGASFTILSAASMQTPDLFIRAIWIVSLLSMIVGCLGALRQNSLKRILAYSSIAHVGYLLIPLLSSTQAVDTVLFYLVGYGLVNFGLFAFLLPLGSDDSIRRISGLSKTKPIAALGFSLLLLSLAGLPPGLLGFFGKVQLFTQGISAGYTGLVLVAVVSSVVSLFYYMKIISVMYFQDQHEAAPAPSFAVFIGVLSSIAVFIFGLVPAVVYNWIKNSL